jgi:predicted Fe-Mo cluster-binding NifX family protein
MQKIKLAIPTEGGEGLEDTVSEVFGRAKTFTIVEIRNDSINSLKIVDNPAVSYKHGAGPIVVKTLVDMGVTVVAAREFGQGASALLEQHNVKRVRVKPGIKVTEAVQNVLK